MPSGTARWGLTQSLCGALLAIGRRCVRSNCLCLYQPYSGRGHRQPLGGIYLYRLLIQESQNDRIRSARLRGDQLTLGYGSHTVAKP